ncbi:MAG: CHASE2 domain-containing protein [Thermodesulfovibrionales bacterium]
MKRFSGIASFTIIFSLIIYLSFPGRHFDMKVYDFYSCIRGIEPPLEDIVIVGIDEESFLNIDLPWPWPRSLHGQLIKALRSAGAKVIVMDIIFSDPSMPVEDKAMADAIKKYGNVVLSADLETVKTEKFAKEILITPLEEFLKAGASFGISSILLDADNVVRRFFWGTQEVPSLEATVLKVLGISKEMDNRSMVHFRGPAHHIPYVSYFKALKPDFFLPDGFFKDKIVLVGKYYPNEESKTDIRYTKSLYLQIPGSVRGIDMFATPFYIIDERFTPGIEIHANMLSSLLKDDALKPLKKKEAVFLILFLSLFLTFLNHKWRPLKSTILNIFLGILYVLLSYLLFNKFGLFLPFTAVLSGILINFVSSGVISYSGVEKKRRYLRKAFSFYLSPQVAKRVLESPERLKLGGQRVYATVLFSDLAGFTEISEINEPEDVVSILTRYTTEMAKIIFEYHGTLDKFIGDAIMAVWGTPAEDNDQALHACLAALKMQRHMKTVAQEIIIPGYRITMRVGINSGIVMAGNMGSEERFDFTVIGDNVNIASRLESLNKIYGTEIIISESTMQKIRGKLTVRELDKVRVKGKRLDIKIFELVDGKGGAFIEIFESGLDLYRKGYFDSALKKFQECLEANPQDKPSRLFIERCKYLIKSPPKDWDGIWATE